MQRDSVLHLRRQLQDLILSSYLETAMHTFKIKEETLLPSNPYTDYCLESYNWFMMEPPDSSAALKLLLRPVNGMPSILLSQLLTVQIQFKLSFRYHFKMGTKCMFTSLGVPLS